MRDQLKRLEELQTHDAKIQELENSLKAIPLKLAATQTAYPFSVRDAAKRLLRDG